MPIANPAKRSLSRFRLVVTAAALLISSRAASAQSAPANCVQPPEAHQKISVLVVDRTDKLADTQNLLQSLNTLKSTLQPGERLAVVLSVDKLSDAHLNFDMVKPQSSIWESSLKIRAKERGFESCFETLASKLKVQDEEHDHSAILETMSFAKDLLKSDSSASKRLVLFSDMVQNSETVSFYKEKAIDPASLMKRVDSQRLLHDLKGIDVYVAGAGSQVSDQRGREIEQFWRKYFESSGSQLKFYGPLLPGA